MQYGDCEEVLSRTHAWSWIDSRTRKRVSNSSCFTREQAEKQLAHWQERDRKGGRPDLHKSMPYIIAALVPFGSRPGDYAPPL